MTDEKLENVESATPSSTDCDSIFTDTRCMSTPACSFAVRSANAIRHNELQSPLNAIGLRPPFMKWIIAVSFALAMTNCSEPLR